MNFKQLEYFSAVAEAKSISMAARNLNVAQPPVSRQISLLEDELGVCLFLRNNKGIELTEAGQCLYQQTQKMFQSLRMMTDSVRDVDAGIRGQVKIGIIYSDVPVMTEHLREYHKLYPQVELYIRMGSPSDLLDDLNRGKLHVLFLRSQTEGVTGLHKKVLGEDPLELVMCRETDPAPGQAEVPIGALEGAPMCLLRSDDLWGYSNYLLNECRREGSPPISCASAMTRPWPCRWCRRDSGSASCPVPLWIPGRAPGFMPSPSRALPPCPIRCWSGATMSIMPAASKNLFPWWLPSGGTRRKRADFCRRPVLQRELCLLVKKIKCRAGNAFFETLKRERGTDKIKTKILQKRCMFRPDVGRGKAFLVEAPFRGAEPRRWTGNFDT